jgi:hypothetical protein
MNNYIENKILYEIFNDSLNTDLKNQIKKMILTIIMTLINFNKYKKEYILKFISISTFILINKYYKKRLI